MIGGGVAAGRAGAQHPGQLLAGVIASSDVRVMAVAFEIRLCQFLVCARSRRSRPAGCRSRPRARGPRPGPAAARHGARCRCAHACSRALLTAAVTLRRLRSPPVAVSFSARHAVGTDATCPNSSRWSPITRKSLITRTPSAIAHARSDKTRPRRARPAATAAPPSGRRQARPVREHFGSALDDTAVRSKSVRHRPRAHQAQ